MSIIVPRDPGSTLSDAEAPEHTNSSKSINEGQQFHSLHTPFYDLSSDELLEELWKEGVDRRFNPPSYSPKKRGNYVRSYVLSKLRIQAKSTRLKVKWNLEALWDTLPVELIISIFEFLHPIDLYHAIRTTKGLRCFLLDKNSTTIWRESFLNHPDIPFYPPEVSAPKWASLIFGPAICDDCGADNSLVDYTFWLRKCEDCMDYVYSDEEDVLLPIQLMIGGNPDELDNVWSLALKVYRYDSFFYATEEEYNIHEPRYSVNDVTRRVYEMRKHLLDILSGATDAHTNYQTFLNDTRAATQERMKHAKRSEIWAQDIYQRSENAFIASFPAFRIKCKKALLKQGYDLKDIERAQSMFETMTLTQPNWANISDPILGRSKFWKCLPVLEVVTKEQRTIRLNFELTQRISTRKGNIDACYWKTTKTCLTSDKMRYLPHSEKIYPLKFFADYIYDPQESVGELDVFSAQHHILQYIHTYIATKKLRLLMILLNAGVLPKEATDDSNPDDFLGSAIAVFECCGNSVFVGWEDVGIHTPGSCTDANVKEADHVDTAGQFKFSNIGYQVLKILVELLHLDLQSLSANDLDALNKRFICKTCKFHRKAAMHGLHSMTWRECLTHAKQANNAPLKDRHDPVFDVVSEALTTSILASEQPFPPPSDTKWACNRCDIYFEPIKRAEVISHVKTIHGIAKPVDGEDFLYCRTESCSKRTPLFIGLDEHSNHRCMLCSLPKSLKLWKTVDLFHHISDKHAIQSKHPVEGVDWMKVKVVEDDFWIEEKMRAEGIVSAEIGSILQLERVALVELD